MNTVELNIGLLVERTMQEWDYDLAKSMVDWIVMTKDREYHLLKGIYEGQEQTTLYVKTEAVPELTTLKRWTQELCVVLEQTCIAMVFNDIGYLIYHPRYKGEKHQFDEQYFVRP